MRDREFLEQYVDIPRLNLRADCVSGRALREVEAGPSVTQRTLPWDRMIILVHGYRSTCVSAQKGYAAIVKNIDRCVPRLKAELAGLYWPGDGHLKNPAVYSARVRTAKACGLPFAEFIMSFQRREPGCRMILVGHSLGCRVILEALREMCGHPENRRHKPISLVFLMGAAVPAGYMEDEMRLHDGLCEADRVVVLFSTRDDVLSRWFRPGQRKAEGDEPGNASDAIGLTGAPISGIWHERWLMPSFKHHHYWGNELTVRCLANELGEIYHCDPPSRPAARERSIASGKPLGARVGPERFDDRDS